MPTKLTELIFGNTYKSILEQLYNYSISMRWERSSYFSLNRYVSFRFDKEFTCILRINDNYINITNNEIDLNRSKINLHDKYVHSFIKIRFTEIYEYTKNLTEEGVYNYVPVYKITNKTDRNTFTKEMLEDLKNFNAIDTSSEIESAIKAQPMSAPLNMSFYFDYIYTK